jgi:hypothetical protein
MNYLSHYVFNHDIRNLPPDPPFVMGVALPDLWPRFSRTRRIHWPSVRAAAPADRAGAQLRAGLLNHVAADRAFHALPAFLAWQREARTHARDDAAHPAVLDFVAHVAVELALDHHLVRADGALPYRFYADFDAIEPLAVERRVGRLGRVDATGLGAQIAAFRTGGFLHQYGTRAGLCDVMQRILRHTRIPAAPAADALARALDCAVSIADPAATWSGLLNDGPARVASHAC